MIASDNLIKSTGVFGDGSIDKPILFRGIGHSLVSDNRLTSIALHAHPTTYSYSHTDDEKVFNSSVLLAGPETTLVSLVQLRDNARISFFGSLELFSNDFFNKEFTLLNNKC